MLPIELDIENFYCHSKSVIDFNNFSAAVIVGKIDGNEKFSNGAGKSTIFAAIKYVLFNEVDTTSLEKVIKHGEDSCRVSFKFLSSLDNNVYKIIRFRGRKVGAEVRLFRAIGEDWEDLTQRTPTETDKEIVKLLKISYKTFSNSVLFAQGDVAGIAAMTPRERKIVLKEALQLGVYSKYEKIVKKKLDEINKEIEKNKTIISTIGNPLLDISELESKQELIIPLKKETSLKLEKIEESLLSINQEISSNQSEFVQLTNKSTLIRNSLSEADNALLLINSDLKKYQSKITDLEKTRSLSLGKAKSISEEIKSIKSITLREESEIKNDTDRCNSVIIEQQSDFKQLESKYKDLKVPLSNDSICKHCRQPIDPSARDLCQLSIDKEINEIDNKISQIKLRFKPTQQELVCLEKERENRSKLLNSLREKEFEFEKEKTTTIESSTLIKEFKELFSAKEIELKSKQELKSELLNSQEIKSVKEQEDKLKLIGFSLKSKFSDELLNKKQETVLLSEISNEEAVLIHKIQQRKSDLSKIDLLKKNLNESEYQFILHQKVLTAFGPGGIPALITNTILDDFQIESNNLLDKLRPGLRLQFLTENERSDGEMADTLDITYFLNNTELEFTQLSGAQKLLVSLSLRLGLAAIISKRLGIDLKMILIDEADQSLDEGALETFEQCIKELRKEYKILVITHNPEVKMKFSHAIVVEQDNKSNSTAKVSNEW